MRGRTAFLGLVTLGLALTGCGGGASGSSSRRAPATRANGALVQAAATHEYPSPAPPPEHAPGMPSPVASIERFTSAYVNWNAWNVTQRLLGLARASVGQARSEMVLAAAETRSDTTLRQGGISNAGVVEAVAPRIGHPRQYLVVTRESTAAADSAAYQGLAPAWHLTLVTVVAFGPAWHRRWVVSGWQPEN